MRHRVEGCTIGVAQSLANSAEEMVYSGGNKREQVCCPKKWAAFVRDLGHFFMSFVAFFSTKLFLFVKKQLNLQSKKK